MKYSICVDSVFNDNDFYDALKMLGENGIKSYEFWTWWDKDLDKIKKLNNKYKLNTVTFCTKFIPLNDESKIDEYYKGLYETIEAANKLGCDKIITQVGNEILGLSREKQVENIVKGLKRCIPILKKENKILLVEPLNNIKDHKGTFLCSSNEAFEIIEKVNSKHIRVLFDAYHQKMMGEEVTNIIRNNIDKISHIHIASVIERGPVSINDSFYNNVFKVLDNNNYNDFIGFEYFVKGSIVDKIEKIKELIV